MNLSPRYSWIVLFCCAFAPALRAQWGPYHYLREIGEVGDGWRQIELPDELFRHLRPDYADLRIMGVSAAGDTIEAPYILQLPETRPPVEKMAFSVLNRSRSGGKFFATLESPTTPKINRIQLNLDNPNFDWRVQLEGSNDQRQWFTLLQNYRILSISNANSTYAFTTLHFPEAQYRYYRIAVPTAEEVALSAATSSRQVEQEVSYRSYNILRQDSRNNTAERRTEIDLALAWPVPVSFLQIEVQDTFDYYRPVTIQLLTDSVQTDTGRQYLYTTVHDDVLSSLEPAEFSFSPTRSQAVRIFIDHQDNAPLRLGDLQVKGQVPVIKARFTEPADYRLVYGWKEARAPRYDLSNFLDKIPDDMQVLSLGPEVQLMAESGEAGPLFANKAWLWAVLIGVIAVLGWFSVGMLRGR